jgi:hypothetical protein
LYLQKRLLASDYDEYGKLKPEGSVERRIAQELQQLNKELATKMATKVNMAKFEKIRAEKERTLSEAEYKRWMQANTRVVYSDEFWDMLAKLERVNYGD